MINIAICDDDKEILDSLGKMIYECLDEIGGGVKCSIDSFSDGMHLLGKADEKMYDLFILDIVMPKASGIDVSREIVGKNKVSAIVFLTSSPEFAVDSYDVDALDYILKPIKKDRLLKMFSKFLRQHQNQKTEEIIIRAGNTITRIPLHSLCYAETLNHQVVYHTSDGQDIICRQTLAEAEELLLSHNRFIKPHRSYIVNQDYINKISSGCITMKNGEHIWASRSNMKDLAETYLKYKVGKIGGDK